MSWPGLLALEIETSLNCMLIALTNRRKSRNLQIGGRYRCREKPQKESRPCSAFSAVSANWTAASGQNSCTHLLAQSSGPSLFTLGLGLPSCAGFSSASPSRSSLLCLLPQPLARGDKDKFFKFSDSDGGTWSHSSGSNELNWTVVVVRRKACGLESLVSGLLSLVSCLWSLLL